MVGVGEITSKVETLADLTETITNTQGKLVLDKAVAGYLIGLSVHGYEGSFRATYLSDDTVLSDDLELLDTSIILNVYTKNKCPSQEKYYEQGYYNQETLIDLNLQIQSYLSNKYIGTYYSDGNYGNKILKYDGNFTIYYLKIKPNSKYLISANMEKLPENTWFNVGTYTKDWLSIIEEENFTELYLNNTKTNAYYDNEWKHDTNITSYIIDDTGNDEYLLLYLQNIDIDDITIKDVTEQNYLKTIDPFIVTPNSEMYFSLDNSDYRFVNLYFYDEYKNYLNDWNSLYPDDNISNLTEKLITIPENAYFMGYVINKHLEEDISTFVLSGTGSSIVQPGITGGIIGPGGTGEEEIPEEDTEIETFVITPELITTIKPQLEYGTQKTDFIHYNTQRWEFTLDDELREVKTVNPETEETEITYDEFTIIDKNAVLIKRIAVDDEGNNYILSKPEYIGYGTIEIPIVQGQNILEISNYTPTIIAEYAVQNQYTDLFATKVEVSTVIKQTDQMILLAASKKVSKDDLIQEFNSQIAITPEKILIEGDKITIRSSYFTLTDEGEITATKGTIAGWTIDNHQIYKDVAGYRTALYDGSSGPGYDETSFYAGLPVGETNLHKAGFRIRRNGATNMRYAHILDEEGGLKIWYNETERADGKNQECMIFTRCGFWNYLANGNYWSYLGVSFRNNVDYGYAMFINDAQAFSIVDDLHDLNLAEFKRVGNNSEAAQILFYADTYINGSQVQVNSSDERLKINIRDAVVKALDLINQILHRKFDWIKNGKHISIGYIAQELMKIDPNFVVYNKEFDTYQIDLLYVLATATKAIQEEDEKVEELKNKVEKMENENQKLKEVIKLLGNHSGLSQEIENILNK